MMKKIQVKSRIWIEGANGMLIGNGKLALLEKVIETGSINAASKELDMSYKKAWKIIESMNKAFGKPLVKTETGGKKGGGTIITAEGEELIKLFRKLDKKCRKTLEKTLKKQGF